MGLPRRALDGPAVAATIGLLGWPLAFPRQHSPPIARTGLRLEANALRLADGPRRGEKKGHSPTAEKPAWPQCHAGGGGDRPVVVSATACLLGPAWPVGA